MFLTNLHKKDAFLAELLAYIIYFYYFCSRKCKMLQQLNIFYFTFEHFYSI